MGAPQSLSVEHLSRRVVGVGSEDIASGYALVEKGLPYAADTTRLGALTCMHNDLDSNIIGVIVRVWMDSYTDHKTALTSIAISILN